MENKSFVFRFSDVEVREREFSLLKAGKVLAVEPKAFHVAPHGIQQFFLRDQLLGVAQP